jgi:hypothetical protein
VEACLVLKDGGHVFEKMANSHVFFVGDDEGLQHE